LGNVIKNGIQIVEHVPGLVRRQFKVRQFSDARDIFNGYLGCHSCFVSIRALKGVYNGPQPEDKV